MTLSFQSLRSGSSGNSLLLRAGMTTLLIDAGFGSMRECRQVLGEMLPSIDGVVISHLHSDHIHHYALRVLEEHRVPVYVYEWDLQLLPGMHFRKSPFFSLQLRPFSARAFRIGNFTIRPFPLLHDGIRRTFGFEASALQRGKVRRIVTATDFRDWRNLPGWFENADLIYVEANHDPELLQRHPNRRSHYHLSNGECGRLLCHSFSNSKLLPRAVMLGHLSEIRNHPGLARDTVLEILEGRGFDEIDLQVAPRYESSEAIEI